MDVKKILLYSVILVIFLSLPAAGAGLALIGMGLSNQGETTPGSEGTGGGGSFSGSLWHVVKLPPSWNGSDSTHGKWYTPEKFTELKTTMQEVVDFHKLPADELMGLIQKESSGNPYAFNSKVGATGLGQFTADTAGRMTEFDFNANNRTNPIASLRAMAKKVAFDRENNYGDPNWGTLRPAYLGPQPRQPRGKNGQRWEAYNSGAGDSVYDEIVAYGKEFEEKKYVQRITPAASIDIATGTISTGVLGADNLRTISEQYLGVPYGGSADLYDDSPRCLNCQTFVEKVMGEALKDRLGGIKQSVRYMLQGYQKKGDRIDTPIPGWLKEERNAWPAREATREVARSSGIEDKIQRAQWQDNPLDNLGLVDIDYIPWEEIPNLKANSTIDGTIIAFVAKPVSGGVSHVGFLFTKNGQVILRHSSTSGTGDVQDVPLTQRVRPNQNRYSGIILLRPDESKLR